MVKVKEANLSHLLQIANRLIHFVEYPEKENNITFMDYPI